MKTYRTQKIVALLAALFFGATGAYADTPPWWDKQSPQSALPNESTEAHKPAPAEVQTGTPMLEEYTISLKPAETVDERAREQAPAARAPASPPSPVTAPADDEDLKRYAVQPGDLLLVSVWHEPDLTREVRVSPDGWITYPLVGEVAVEGATIQSLRETLETKLHRYITEAVVDVSVKEPAGNRIYVLGKVNRPGVYAFSKNIDVVQALSLAGGTSKFAATNDIKILRRIDGEQQTYKFRYSDVERGRSLDQNIVLRSGDVVVVP